MEDGCNTSGIKRDPCIECALKHLGQARAIFNETHKGYPAFPVFVWGHMSEAEDELITEHIEQANLIRDERIKYQYDEEYIIPFDGLILDLWTYRADVKKQQLKDLGYGEDIIAEV